MDVMHDTETIDDLSALAWVHDELRRTLEGAHKAMRRYLKDAASIAGSDVDAVDPAVLRTARSQMHQSVGALELVGLPTAAQVLRASESALAKLTGRPFKLDGAAVDAIERTSFALLDYLGRLLAGRPVSPLAMFPQYRVVQELAGADRIHPADLWPHDWQWRDVAADGSAPRKADAALRSEIEAATLALMRQGGTQPAAQLSDLFAGLAAGSARPVATLWHMAAAFFEAQAQSLLAADVYSKRIASRLLAQLRISEKPDADMTGEVSQRLAQDLLFFCAQAASPGDGRRAPRLAAVRQTWGLARRAPVDYLAERLGKHDPAAVAHARKRVAAAKESWSAVAGGEMHRLGTLGEQMHLVSDSLAKLYPDGDRLGRALDGAAAATVAAADAPSAALAMEVATAVLYLEASLDDGEFDHPAQAERVRRLAQRIDEVRTGKPAQPLEAWMEELYRRVSDRQTMGSVVQELKSSLDECEKAIDQFFRRPAERELLHPVPAQLDSMRGVFSVLGIEQASRALVRMRDDVDALAAGSGDAADDALTERLAVNLGALGFLIDMLNVQPATAKSLFAFDEARGLLQSVAAGVSARGTGFGALETMPMVEPRLIEQAHSLAQAAAREDIPLAEVRLELDRLSQEAMVADVPELAETMQQVKSAFEVAATDDQRSAVREELASAMAEFVNTASRPMPLEPEVSRPLPILPVTPTPAGRTGLEEDDEMRAIFLEEAREVIDAARGALAALRATPDDLGELTAVRRAFHTLKGSARMVGLKTFGEAAWSCEQLYNARLAGEPRADEALLGMSTDVLAYLADWTDAIESRRTAGHNAEDVQATVEILRLHGRHQKLALPGAALLIQPMAIPSAAPMAPRRDDKAAPSMPVISTPMGLDLLPVDSLSPPTTLSAAVKPLSALLAPDSQAADFELDLGEAAAMPLGRREDLQSLASPPPEAGAPAPDAVSVMMALDIAPEPSGPAPLPTPLPEPEPEPFKQIGPLRVSIALFNIFLNEADEQSRRLVTAVAEWTHELHRPVGDEAVALAHSLAGNSATVGYADLSHLARLLEHGLMRSHAIGSGDAHEAALFSEAAEEIRRLLHQFAAGLLKAPVPALVERLADHERHAALRLEAIERQQAEAAAAAQAAAPAEPMSLPAATASALSMDLPFELPSAASLEAPFDVTPVAVDAPLEAPVELPVEPVRIADFIAEGEPSAEPPALDQVTVPGALEPAHAARRDAPPSGFGGLGRTEFHDLAPLAPRTDLPHAAPGARDDDDDIDAVDAVDAELWPIFEEEAGELLPQLATRLRDWAERPDDPAGPAACMRTLHTLKGGARLAGAMRLGEMAHRLETAIDHLGQRGHVSAADVQALDQRVDQIGMTFDALAARGGSVAAPAPAPPLAALLVAPVVSPPPVAPVVVAPPALATSPAVPSPAAPIESAPTIDWRRFGAGAGTRPAETAPERAAGGSATVRVRAPLLDRLVNHAGEVSIARSRIENEVGQLKGSLGDLTDNLERLRGQLRDIELQAETQIASRIELAKAAGGNFDPLEMDRFTRFQELTRMMAESVADVATVQRSLQRALQSAEDDLAAQARLTRDLQDDLLRTRMVEFESLSDRLYRVARQAAKELHKQVRLDIVGGSIEVDRGVLERMGGAFEHLLRNSVTHGIEPPAQRQSVGKDATGQITVAVAQEGNEIAVEFRDDGAGLDLARIRERGRAMGLVAAGETPDDAALANLIFTPGFSTAETVTELAGRGVGMDVVRSEVNALGGRIETASAPGQGTSFRLVLPLTTAVTQVVMLRAGALTVAVPATLVEIVRRVPAADAEAALASGEYRSGEQAMPIFWLGALLQAGGRSTEPAGRNVPVVVIKSAQQRIALRVDEVVGNQEVVVKNLGAQLARLPGLAGVTLLASGAPALIYNPVALATLYGDDARAAMRADAAAPLGPASPQVAEATVLAPLVMVVDDSLTVRRVTQRLLAREGYRVLLAKDGLEAIEKLADELPTVVLSDIEMPRMDGFDLVRNLRADPRLAALPVIMITSRIAQKHRDHAAELGVDHYLGKPYAEEDLLALVARYTAAAASVSMF